MNVDTDYEVPEALTIIAGVFLALGALGILIVTGDIIWRRGWRSMMLIMYAGGRAWRIELGLYADCWIGFRRT
jgi:hypothetical protein